MDIQVFDPDDELKTKEKVARSIIGIDITKDCLDIYRLPCGAAVHFPAFGVEREIRQTRLQSSWVHIFYI